MRWIKPGVPDAVPWPLKPDGKYWRGQVSGRHLGIGATMNLDLFIAAPANYGLILLIRTGSAAFVREAVTRSSAMGRPVEGGYVTKDVAITQATDSPIVVCEHRGIATPTEEDAFRELGLRWVDPPARIDARAVVPL